MSAGTEDVRRVLQALQDGYTARDPERLDDVMALFVPDDDLEVIGTGATSFGGFEWCLGQAATRDIVSGDWEGWGDVRLDVEGARIHVLDRVAWLATSATVSMRLLRDEAVRGFLDHCREVLDEDWPAEQKLTYLLRGGTNTLHEAGLGEDFVWPLRFTAVLVHREGGWLFHQVQFSFPTTRFPDERVT